MCRIACFLIALPLKSLDSLCKSPPSAEVPGREPLSTRLDWNHRTGVSTLGNSSHYGGTVVAETSSLAQVCHTFQVAIQNVWSKCSFPKKSNNLLIQVGTGAQCKYDVEARCSVLPHIRKPSLKCVAPTSGTQPSTGSRAMGQVMQCPPPRPRPSSAPRMVMTSMPALRSAVLVSVLRS